MKKRPVNKVDKEKVKALEGIYRKTLAFNDQAMLCIFYLEKNAFVPLHQHEEHQIGYVLKGKLRFLTQDGDFLVQDGDSYVFNSNEKHGAEVLEDTEVIEVFSPAREDYK